MRREKYKEIRDDLFTKYGEFLCEDARQDLNAATNIYELVNVLHKYVWDIWKKDFSGTRFIRKWFADELEVFNACGCYLDQNIALTDPDKKSIICFGRCYLTVILSKPTITHFLLQDNTNMNLCTFGTCTADIRIKNAAKCQVLNKFNTSRIKIRSNK